MDHELPKTDWTMALVAAINDADDGDTIICHSDNMRQLAKIAHARMCPDKTLIFTIR